MLGITEVLIALVTVMLVVQFQKLYWAVQQLPPGPLPLPCIGNLWTLKFSLHPETLIQLSKTYGNVITLWAGPTPVVVFNGYEAVRDMLISNSEATSGRPVTPALKTFADEKGVAMSNGHAWRQQRRFCVLTLRKLGVGNHSMECRIQEEARHMVEHFVAQKGRAVNPRSILMSSTTNVIAAMVFGHRFAMDDDTLHKLTEASSFVTHFMCSTWGQLYSALPSLIGLLPGPPRMNLMYLDFLKGYMKQEIKTHQESRAGEPQDLIDFYLDQIAKTHDDQMSTFDESNLTQTLIDFLVAGSETVALTLQWALLHMVSHPDIQEKIQKELATVLEPSHVIEYEDRRKLPYTNAAIHEVLRCNAVVPIGLPRWCVKDTTIQGLPIKKGTVMIANLSSVGVDTEHWERPQQFNPNHFLAKDGSFLMQDAFLPFAAGHRVCVGERLAKTQLFIFFANLLRDFTFRLPNGVEAVNLNSISGTTMQPVPYEICALPNQDAMYN